jgi:hypothetical protein
LAGIGCGIEEDRVIVAPEEDRFHVDCEGLSFDLLGPVDDRTVTRTKVRNLPVCFLVSPLFKLTRLLFSGVAANQRKKCYNCDPAFTPGTGASASRLSSGCLHSLA